MQGKSNKKKKFQKSVSIFCAVLLVISALFYPQPVKASAGNPYPQTYSDGEGYHPGNCTWQVWEEAYTRLGIQLPGWGNAGGWCDKARAAGYTVVDYTDGAVPPSDCIIEWSGHVGWVLSADAVGANIREGNIKLNGAYQAVHEQWWSWEQLRKYRGNPKGFIILNGGGAVGNANVSYSNLHTTFVDTWNAGLYGEINNPNRLTVSEVGVQIWDSAGTLVVNHKEGCGLNNSVIKQELNVVGEVLPSGLRSGETYTWKMFAVVNGNTCESGTEQFTVVDDQSPVISNITVTDISSEGYTISCTVTDNYRVEKVQFPTWTEANDQDDIQEDWGNSSKAAGTKNGDNYTFRVNISEHKNESGLYHTHIYAWDKAGNYSISAAPDTKVPEKNAEPTSVPAPATTVPSSAPSTEAPSAQQPDITLAPMPVITPSAMPSTPAPIPAITPSAIPGTPVIQQPVITPEPNDSQSVNFGYPILQNLTDKSVTLKYVIPSQYITGWGMYFGTDLKALQDGFGGNPNRDITTMQWDKSDLLPNTTYYYYFYYSSEIKTVASKLFSFTTYKTNSLSNLDFNSVTTKGIWDDRAGFTISIPPQNLNYWGYYLGTDLTNMKEMNGGNNHGYLISEISMGIYDLAPDTTYYFYIYYVTESRIVQSTLYNFKTNSKSSSSNNNDKPVITAPKKVVLYSADSFKKKSMFVTWYSTDEVDGYQLQYATNKKFKSAKSIMINSRKIETKTIKKLKSKKKYYVRVRAYRLDDGKKKLYGKWSKVKSCKIK